MPSQYSSNPDSLSSSAHYVAYPGAVADTNLSAEGNGPCRRIRCTGAGDLVVKRPSDNTNVTIPFLAGETIEVQASALVATGSTATGVVVFW